LLTVNKSKLSTMTSYNPYYGFLFFQIVFNMHFKNREREKERKREREKERKRER